MKENKYSSELEIVVRNSSELEKSPHNFSVDVSQLKDTTRPLITLDQLSECINFQQVSVQIKVLCITEVIHVTSQENKQLNKQECVIADATGSSKIILWNDIFAEECCYLVVKGQWFARIKEVNTSL